MSESKKIVPSDSVFKVPIYTVKEFALLHSIRKKAIARKLHKRNRLLYKISKNRASRSTEKQPGVPVQDGQPILNCKPKITKCNSPEYALLNSLGKKLASQLDAIRSSRNKVSMINASSTIEDQSGELHQQKITSASTSTPKITGHTSQKSSFMNAIGKQQVEKKCHSVRSSPHENAEVPDVDTVENQSSMVLQKEVHPDFNWNPKVPLYTPQEFESLCEIPKKLIGKQMIGASTSFEQNSKGSNETKNQSDVPSHDKVVIADTWIPKEHGTFFIAQEFTHLCNMRKKVSQLLSENENIGATRDG